MDFKNFQMRAGLSDTAFEGNKFTWTNNTRGGENILERLDRYLVNGRFIAEQGLPKVTHLVRFGSDHSPILCDKADSIKSRARFHYLRIW